MRDGQKAVSMMSVSPDPEVTPKAKLRIFGATYKKTILAEGDAAGGSGNIGQILRREAIYSSTLTRWRREREAALESALSRPGNETQSI